MFLLQTPLAKGLRIVPQTHTHAMVTLIIGAVPCCLVSCSKFRFFIQETPSRLTFFVAVASQKNGFHLAIVICFQMGCLSLGVQVR